MYVGWNYNYIKIFYLLLFVKLKCVEFIDNFCDVNFVVDG